jgi:hypothetical protein
MMKILTNVLLIFAVFVTPASAMPIAPQSAIPDAGLPPVIKVLSSSQKAAGRRVCRAQYGARLAYVTYSRTRYTCHFRKSTKKLTKEAAQNCRKSGLRLVRVNSIKIKGNRSITRFTCKRR